MNDTISETEALSAIVGARVVAAEPCRWGFENRTAIATLEDGRRLVVQRINSRAWADHKLHLARMLPDRLAAVGVRAPHLLAADAAADPPYAVREYLPGEPGASLMGTVAGAIEVARAMGALLPRLALVETADAGLNDTWASPASLVRQAQQQLQRCRPLLDDSANAALEAAIVEVPARFASRPTGFAHGDFCPVNVLLEIGDWGLETGDRELELGDASPASASQSPIPYPQSPHILGLLDFEFARIADPLFDAAWWGWVVRYHHPERWVYAWPHLLAAAGIPDKQETNELICMIQRLRCLEMIDYCATTRTREVAAMWVARLGTTLGWA
jgi:aminoglycoside phosphotransferase (APT) family kinase protein